MKKLILGIMILVLPASVYGQGDKPFLGVLRIGYHFFPASPYFERVEKHLPGAGNSGDYSGLSVALDELIQIHPQLDIGVCMLFHTLATQHFSYDGYRVSHQLLAYGASGQLRYYTSLKHTWYLAGGPVIMSYSRYVDGVMGEQIDQAYTPGAYFGLGRQFLITGRFGFVLEYDFYYIPIQTSDGRFEGGGHTLCLGLFGRNNKYKVPWSDK